MQQRGTNSVSMETECEENKVLHARSRNNSKLKVLVRSHAMREEASPPREPTPLVSPSIKLTPSPADSPNSALLVTSPVVSRRTSPARCSPGSRDAETTLEDQTVYMDGDVDPRYLNNNRMNRENLENSRNGEANGRAYNEFIHIEKTSHADSRKVKGDKYICDCTNQNCVKCVKGQDRNINNNFNCNLNNNCNTLTVSRPNLRGGKLLRHQSSSQGSFEGSSSNSPCLSRDSSSEQYTDTSGIDLELFIPETLNRNAKDRALMLRIEQELVNLAKDKVKSHYKFPPMSSYQRMLVHRCAAYFGMDHNVESSGKCVVVNKTKCTRIPDVQFKQHIKSDIVFSDEPRRSILKRDSNSVEDYCFKSPDRQHSLENRRSKSFEEREEEYEKVRRRIFDVEQYSSNDELAWAEIPWSSLESDNSTRFRLQPPEHHGRSTGRLLKVQSEEAGEETMRPCVAKSYSFGGYGGVSLLTRGDSVISTRSAGPRLFTKQDSASSSVSWRLSPSSSGYKTQSQRSESVTPSPTSTPYLSGQDSTNSVGTNTSETQVDADPDTQVVWAVTDIQSVPKGSIIINPQTGQPVKNNDGSIYHYDPTNPPPGLNSSNMVGKPPPSPQKAISPVKTKDRSMSPKKRPPRASPIKKSITNSSTSPSLPFTPPPHQTRSFPYIPATENVSNLPIQQQYSMYGGSYGPAPDASVQVYQQPCIVYAQYGVPMQYDGRLDPQMQEVSGYYMNVASDPSPQPLTYQPAQPVWNQQPMYYSNPTPNATQRFSVPLPNQAAPYISTAYPTNFVPQHGQSLPAMPQQNPEVVPVFSQQSIQMMYPNAGSQSNPMVYPNQSIIYTQNPVYSTPVYPPAANLPYPQSTSTPNSCTSSVSNTAFCGPLPDMNAQQSAPMGNYDQLVQNMGQLGLNSISSQQAFAQMKPYVHNDARMQKNTTPKGNKFSNPRGFGMGSSQSSTGTSSPAMTVVAGYCTNPNAGIYRTPPETPSVQHGYNLNYGHPLMRQATNVRASPPAANRSSRSPTPGSDIAQYRVPIPPVPSFACHRMPYIHPDARIISCRGQTYRQPVRQQCFQGMEFKSHRNRKPRGGNKIVPPVQPNTKLEHPNSTN